MEPTPVCPVPSQMRKSLCSYSFRCASRIESMSCCDVTLPSMKSRVKPSGKRTGDMSLYSCTSPKCSLNRNASWVGHDKHMRQSGSTYKWKAIHNVHVCHRVPTTSTNSSSNSSSRCHSTTTRAHVIRSTVSHEPEKWYHPSGAIHS